MIRRRRRKPASAEYVFQHSIDLYSGVGFNLQEPTGAVSGAYNTKLDLGRDLVIEGAFPNDPGVWIVGANWSIAGGKATYDDVATTQIYQPLPIQGGATYQISFDIADVSAGAARLAFADDTGAVAYVAADNYANGSHVVNSNVIASTQTTFAVFGFDSSGSSWSITNIVVKQTDIAASSEGGGLLDGTDTGTTPGVAGGSRIRYTKSSDAVTTDINVYSAALNSMFNPDSGGLFMIASSDTWAAGIDYLISLAVSANYGVSIRRSATNLIVSYETNATEESITIASGSPAGLFGVGLIWNTSGSGAVTGLYQGAQSGAVQTIANAWVGNLASTLCTIFALNTTPTNSWAGDGAYPILYTSAPPISEFTRYCYAMGVI